MTQSMHTTLRPSPKPIRRWQTGCPSSSGEMPLCSTSRCARAHTHPSHCRHVTRGVIPHELKSSGHWSACAVRSTLLLMPGLHARYQHTLARSGELTACSRLSVPIGNRELAADKEFVPCRHTPGITMARPTPSTANLWGAKTKNACP